MARNAIPDKDQDDEHFRSAFAEFERAVLQDNIMLCDQKSGILLAFAAAMILVSLQGFATREAHKPDGVVSILILGGFLFAAVAFLATCYFALATVTPRIRKGPDDHIFWESRIFLLPVEQYVARFREMDTDTERENQLRYLHTMARICRTKFHQFAFAMRFGLLGFIALVLAYVGNAFT